MNNQKVLVVDEGRSKVISSRDSMTTKVGYDRSSNHRAKNLNGISVLQDSAVQDNAPLSNLELSGL